VTWHDERVDELGLRALLDDVQTGAVTADDAVARLRRLPFADVDGASVDHHRHLRSGLPEAVYGPGKTSRRSAWTSSASCSPTAPARCCSPAPTTPSERPASTRTVPRAEASRSLLWRQPDTLATAKIAVVTAGTSDIAVADEAVLTLRAYGFDPSIVTDVGVAGLHRLLARLDDLTDADALIVIAGMEGALASVLGGLTGAPVVAVPTSVGYGSGLDGVTALLAMHASCASGVTVVGIDNGFGAACAIARMFTWPNR
jgi:pyridinium-3,5-biscarboxylic acid mononucleotide synthase